MRTPTLGERITFTHSLHRRSGWGEHFGTRPGHRKAWEPRPASWLIRQAENLHGIVVGIRTLSNGHVTYGDWEDGGHVYHADKDGSFTAYLVAYDVRRKPVYVLPEHCTPELSAVSR